MKNKMVIISGATGGIGSELSNMCLANPEIQNCVFLYRNSEKFKKILNGTKSTHVESCLYNMEKDYDKNFLGDIHGLELAEEIRLILVAFSIVPIKLIENLEIDEIEKNIRINILSQINIINRTNKFAKKYGKKFYIVNIDSGAAYRALKGWSLYSGAKAYINMYLKTLNLEEKVEIVSYDPGVVDTEMQEYIRKSDINDKNQKKQFQDYFNNNFLNSANEVATDIFKKYIEDWLAVDFEERYKKS